MSGTINIFKPGGIAAFAAAAKSGPIVPPAPSVDALPLHSPILEPAPTAVPLNIDRDARPIAAPPVAMPAGLASSSSASVAPAAATTHTNWMDWAKAHWPWLLGALLLLLLVIAMTERQGKHGGGSYSPRPIGKGRMVKGSPEARAHMASLRSRRT